jgi:ferric-dicitrate binding protein FerR (iron transport regulator)
MNVDDRSSVWTQYRQAKEQALAAEGEEEPDAKMSLEELEAAIAQAAASSGLPETGLPPRAAVHPSKQRQLSRWFYRALLFLFAVLTAGLVWWGRQKYGS